jgi:CRP/FNR family transcriptional regulator
MLAFLPLAELDALMSHASYMKVPAGTVMFDEEQPCGGFPLVLSGSARVIKASPNGRELHLYSVLPGETCVLTTGCLLGNEPYHARGMVQQDMEFVMLPSDTFRKLFSRLEPFRDHVFSRFSQRMTELLELVSAVAFQKLDQRLAALLIAKRTPVRATHQALADELGSLREIVSRLLKSFADQAWVKLGREQIDILDEAALKRFVNL